MQQIIQKVTYILGGLVICAAMLLSSRLSHAAGSAIMYLSPSSGSVANGSILSLDIHENSSSANTNAARVVLTYPSGSLSFVSFTPSSAFSIVAYNQGAGGSARYDVGSLGGVTGDQVIATVKFTATAGSGSAAVNISPPNASNPNDPSSSILTSSDGTTATNILSSVSGGSYSLTGSSSSPAPSSGTSSPSPSSSSSSSKSSGSVAKPNTSSSSSSASNGSAGQKTALAISAVTVGDLTTNTATISWQTSAPASSEVNYGLNTKLGLSAISGTLVTSHSVALDPKFLAAGTEYHFIVKSIDASGSGVSSQDTTFRTKGVSLTVTVTDQKKQAVKGAKVTVAGVSGTTNSSGKVVLNDLPVGTQEVSVLSAGKITKTKIKIEPIASKGSNQTASIKIGTGNQLLDVWIALAGIGVIAAVVGGNYYLLRRKQSLEAQRHFPQVPEQVAEAKQTDSSPSLLDITSTPPVDPPGTVVGGQQSSKPAGPAAGSEANTDSKQEINPNER